MKRWFTLLAVLAGGCSAPAELDGALGDVVQSANPIEVALALGSERRVDSRLRVAFTNVASDSRCPTSVVCVWAGDGAAEIAYAVGTGPSRPDTLHTTLEPKSVEFEGYVLTLLELSPHPRTTDAIPRSQYSVRLRIARKS
jgi:hypothetical protein